jgi:hypothetical protein
MPMQMDNGASVPVRWPMSAISYSRIGTARFTVLAGCTTFGGVRSREESAVKSILDPSFKYTSSANTDLVKTFARIRRIQRECARAAATRLVERATNVSPFRRPASTDDKAA